MTCYSVSDSLTSLTNAFRCFLRMAFLFRADFLFFVNLHFFREFWLRFFSDSLVFVEWFATFS